MFIINENKEEMLAKSNNELLDKDDNLFGTGAVNAKIEGR